MKQILDRTQQEAINCDKLRRAHYIAWEMQSKLNLKLGLPVVVLTAVAGSAIFANCDNTDFSTISIFVGMASFAATVLSALQTFLKPSEKAEAHKSSAVRYASMKRQFRAFNLEYADKDESFRNQAMNEMKNLFEKLDFYAEISVAIPEEAMEQADDEFRNKVAE